MLVAAAPGAIAGTVFSVLADYRSRRVIAAGGAFGFAAALAVYGLATSFPMLVVASFAHGCAATALCDATELALVDVSGDDAPAAVSRSHLFGAVGDLLGPVALILATATGIGWRGAFLVCAVLVLVYAIWIATLPIPAPRAHEHERARDGLREVVRDRRVWFCAMVALLLGPLDEPFLAFLIADLEGGRGMSTEAATAIAVAWTLGSLIALATTSRAGYRCGPRALPRTAALLAAAAAGCAVAPAPFGVAACAFAFGFAAGRFFIALDDPHPRPASRPTRNRVRRHLRGRVHRLSPPTGGRRARRHVRRRCRPRLLRDDRGRPVRRSCSSRRSARTRTVVHRVG